MSKFIRFYYSLSKSFLNPVARYAILELQKEQPPQYKGLANKKIEIPRYRPSIQGGFSNAHYWDFIEKRYLQLTKIKVSNAIMNIPKAISSLKSKFIMLHLPSMYDGRLTLHLYEWKANALAVTRLSHVTMVTYPISVCNYLS